MIRALSKQTVSLLAMTSKRAMEFWPFNQICIASAEELCELSVKLCQHVNGKVRPDQRAGIQEEIADCYIMLDKLALGFFDSSEDFEATLLKKLTKLLTKLEGAPL